MDPQQRLLLHAAVEALEDAGYAPNSTPTFQKDTLGVYVGVATEDYIDNLRDEIDVYYSPGKQAAIHGTSPLLKPSQVLSAPFSVAAYHMLLGSRAPRSFSTRRVHRHSWLCITHAELFKLVTAQRPWQVE